MHESNGGLKAKVLMAKELISKFSGFNDRSRVHTNAEGEFTQTAHEYFLKLLYSNIST